MSDAARPDLLDAVGEDSDLTPDEKETSITFTKRDDTARMFTAEAGLARRLLAHPHTSVVSLDVLDGNGARCSVAPDEYTDGEIVGVVADVPVGAFTVQRDPRKSDQHAKVITRRVLREVSP